MRSERLVRRLTIAAGGTAIIAMVGFTAACGNNGEKAPETSTTPTTSTTTTSSSTAAPAPAVTPSEKSLDPNGGSLFTPNITASQQYTPSLGHH
ncbi:MAG: hypothetical protein WCE30_03435 [Mycobacterium sp.]